MKDYNSYGKINMVEWSAKKLFDVQLASEGSDIEINDISQRAIIRNHGSVLDSFKEERYLMTDKGVIVNKGDYIKYLNDTYLVITQIDKDNPFYNDCKMFRCNYNAKIMLSNGKLIEMPIIKEYKTLYSIGVEVDRTIEWGAGKLSFQIRDTDDTKLITRGTRLYIDNHVWEVKNDEKHDGILIFMCSETEENSNLDDTVNGIADYYKYRSRYEISCNPTTLNLNVSDTQQLTATVLENGVEMVSPTISYTSSDGTKVSVDSTGMVTALDEGNDVLITCKYIDGLGNEYTSNCSVNVSIPVVPDLFTTSMTYDGTVGFTVRKYQSGIYRGHLFNNGVEIPSTWVFTVSEYTGSANATTTSIVENTSSYIKIKNVSATSGSLTINGVCGTNTITQVINFIS